MVHHHFKEIDSTNDWGRSQISTFEREALTIVSADKQLKGRGRYGRNWLSPEGLNLYASFCFFIDEVQQDPLFFTHIMAISVITLLEERGIKGRIKWPNDVRIAGKKICGILCETLPLPPQCAVIVGVGLNVNMPSQLLQEIDQPATSLLAESGKVESVEKILTSLSAQFERDLTLFLRRGFEPFLARFQDLMGG